MEDRALLHFFTSGDWSLSDLQRLLAAIDGLYGLAFSIRLRSRRRSGAAQRIEQAFVVYPRTERERAGSWFGGAGERAAPLMSIAPELQHVSLLFGQKDQIAPEQQLRVKSIVMRSPGSISLLGLGELVHAIRELIKDFSYRNRQERELGNLEIIKQRLAIADQFSELAADQISLTALEFLSDLGSLEGDGKIRLGFPSSAVRDLRCAFTDALSPGSRELPQVRHAERVFSELEQEIEGEEFGLVDRTIDSLRRQINEARKAGAVNSSVAADLRRKLAQLNEQLALDATVD